MKLSKILVFVSLLVCSQINSLLAQQSNRFTESNVRLKEAIHYVDMQYYQQAYLLLSDYLTHFRQDNRTMQELDNQKAAYYYFLCGLKIKKTDAEKEFSLFLKETPFEHLKQMGYFELGRYYYQHTQFEKTIQSYEAVSIESLTNQELIQRNFELGYAYLVTQRLDKVESYFQSAKNIPGDYFNPGNYYHGLLAYYKKNYSEARTSFNAVKEDERYKKIIPFYLTEIDYLTGEKEKALSTALQYLQSGEKLYYDRELNQMVAQIYVEQEDYSKAEFYYLKVMRPSNFSSEEDYFKLAYCQYQQGKIKEAIPNFESAMTTTNEFSPLCVYFLALCHFKNDQKTEALSILSTHRTLFEEEKQRALIEYTIAKLSYEGSNDVNAFAELNAFVKRYPDSEYAEEANELLAYLHIKYENFDDAVLAMNKMKNISYKLKKVYQKANYARGIQLLVAENADRAIFNFQETKKFPIDKTTVSLADFWLAECNYRLGRYVEAMINCTLFLQDADTLSLREYTRKIHLIQAYIYFNHSENEQFVNEYVLATGDTNTNDLLARIGTSKPNFIPEKIPVIDNDPYLLIYNLPEENMEFKYKPIPLKPLALTNEIKHDDQTNFIKLMLGNLSSMEVKAGYNFDHLVKVPLYLEFNRSSSTGKIRFQQMNQTHFGVHSNTLFNDHTIKGSLEIDRSKLYYYGYDKSLFNYQTGDVKQVFFNIGLKGNIIPLVKNKYDIKYKADMYAGIYTDKSGAGEYAVRMDAPVSKQLKPDLLAQSDILMDVNVYFVKGKNSQGNSLFAWRPSISKQMNRLRIKAGLYPTLGKRFYLLPDLSLQYAAGNTLSKKSTLFELALQSTIRLNNFKQMTELNPFIITYYDVKQTLSTEIYAGVKGTMASNCSYSFRTGIALLENAVLFLNDTASDYKQFKVFTEKQATAFLLDASIEYAINDEMLAGAKINLHPIIDITVNREAWHYVPSTLAFYGKIRATKDVMINADLYLMAGSKAIEKNSIIFNPYTKSLAPGLDMNLSIRYAFTRRWNVLIDVNNLFGSKYQRWYGYPMLGTNVMVGFVHSFANLSK